ncbi:MAG TPA: hypothetical protein PKH07_05550 [bacterium]|nr:hypothetical protein [bacterium]
MLPESLVHKPDFRQAVRRWEAFWQGEMIDRPCLVVTAPKEGATSAPHPAYMAGHTGCYREVVEQYDRWAQGIWFGAEAMPFLEPSFGPDVFAAFVGAELKYDTATSWAVPFVEDWESVLPLDLTGEDWKRMKDYVQTASEFAKGRFLIGMLDLHSNMDCLASIRNPQRLCMDVLDCPELVDRAMQNVQKLYPKVFEEVYRAGSMANQGCIGWTPVYSPKRFAVTQCDFICMLGPEQARRFVIPALAEEAAYLDHCVYHYDGPGALKHLDDILAIADIDCIQWVEGAGNPPLIEWMDLLKKIQAAGKSVEVRCPAEQIPIFHKNLLPDRVVYITNTATQKQAEELIIWLKANS